MLRATNEPRWYRTALRSPEPLLFIQEKGQKSPHKKSITQLDYLYFNIQRKENYTPPHSRRNVDANSIVRWMFWSDWGRVPKIERAGMDGSHRSFEWNLEKFVIIFIVGRSSFKAVFDGPMVLLLIWFLTGISMKKKSKRVLWKSILRLYWVDAKLSTIGSSALDGSEVLFVLQIIYLSYFIYLTRKWSDPSAIVQARIILFSTSTLRHPFSIAVFEDFM